ncbi:MAG: hypothetical protein SFV19_08760 [Rhodospirillaceae bacterium]|nr:hypothetical protein [Rhodospirillaceae bacterium]
MNRDPFSAVRRHGLSRGALALALFCAASAGMAQDELPSLTVRGLIDGRIVLPDNTLSWENGGLGKTRYGGEPDAIARLAEASLILQPKLTWDLSGFVHLSTNTQQKHAVDIVEAFLSYRPVPTSPFGVRAKAGAFFPPISLENTGLAWTSPYTISSSAINSWIGEELRSTGGEVTAFHQGEDVTVSLTGSGFYFNDPAGTLLAWRGWAIHDRKSGVLERLARPSVRIVRPGARLQRQAPYNEPFHELDDRMAYYMAGRVEHADWGELRALYYNNPGDDRALTNGQWPWNPEFVALGGKTLLPGDVDLIAQFMQGNTTVVTVPGAASPVVHLAYMSGFVLASHEWDRHRLSLRLEYFETDDKDLLFPDNNNEWGNAVTAAYVFRPAENQRLTFEVLRVHSTRPERTLSFGLPRSVTETEIQASYRFFF